MFEYYKENNIQYPPRFDLKEKFFFRYSLLVSRYLFNLLILNGQKTSLPGKVIIFNVSFLTSVVGPRRDGDFFKRLI